MSTNVTLNWTPVTTNQLGQPLQSPISKYFIQVYSGDPSNILSPTYQAPGNQSSLAINNLPDGVLGFRIRAEDADDDRGNLSEWVTVDTTPIVKIPPADVQDLNVTIFV